MPETSTWAYEILIKRAPPILISQIVPVLCEVGERESGKEQSVIPRPGPHELCCHDDAGGCWNHWTLPPHHKLVMIFGLQLCWLCLRPPLGLPGCPSSANPGLLFSGMPVSSLYIFKVPFVTVAFLLADPESGCTRLQQQLVSLSTGGSLFE